LAPSCEPQISPRAGRSAVPRFHGAPTVQTRATSGAAARRSVLKVRPALIPLVGDPVGSRKRNRELSAPSMCCALSGGESKSPPRRIRKAGKSTESDGTAWTARYHAFSGCFAIIPCERSARCGSQIRATRVTAGLGTSVQATSAVTQR